MARVHGSRTHHGTRSAPSAVLKTEDITGCLALSGSKRYTSERTSSGETAVGLCHRCRVEDGLDVWVLAIFVTVVFASLGGGFTLLGCYFIGRWIREPRLTSLSSLAVGVASLGVVCGLMFVYGEAYFTAWILMVLWASSTLTAIVFLWRSRHMARGPMVIATALLAVGYPALLLQMPPLSETARRDEWDACAAPLVVDALARYRAVAARYPARFDDLYHEFPPRTFIAPPRPTYEPLDTLGGRGGLKCLATPWSTNWLYTTTGPDYALGYWRRYPVIEPLAARVCLYRSDDPGWRCGWNDWGPFSPRP